MNDIRPPARPSSASPPRPSLSPRPRAAAPPRQRPPDDDMPLPQQPLTLPPVSIAPEVSLRRARRPRRSGWLWIIISIFLAVVIAAGIYYWYNDALQPLSSSDTKTTIEVPPGSVADTVSSALERQGLIKSALALQLYIKFHNKADIKAGTYAFMPKQAPAEMLQWLSEGRTDTSRVTILPGKTLTDIKKTLEEHGFMADDIDLALAAPYPQALLAGRPGGATLEGYIYPETHELTASSTPQTVVSQSLDTFAAHIEKLGLTQKLEARGLSLYQGITLASMIEKEVAHATDKRQVSQVFHKRLAAGAKLDSDPTYKYAAALLNTRPSVDVDSPYNTYKHAGLPPGPIGNFTIDSLEAAANPAEGDYWYFVAGDDGATHFSRTFEEHERNIKQYCQKLCAGF